MSAHKEGREAWRKGALMSDNPYPESSERAINWDRGYRYAHMGGLINDKHERVLRVRNGRV